MASESILLQLIATLEKVSSPKPLEDFKRLVTDAEKALAASAAAPGITRSFGASGARSVTGAAMVLGVAGFLFQKLTADLRTRFAEKMPQSLAYVLVDLWSRGLAAQSLLTDAIVALEKSHGNPKAQMSAVVLTSRQILLDTVQVIGEWGPLAPVQEVADYALGECRSLEPNFGSAQLAEYIASIS